MCRLNSSHWALITLLSFVSTAIAQHTAWLWALLSAPLACAQSMERGHPCSQHRAGISGPHSCPENSPPARTGCLKVKQTTPSTFLGNHLARQVKGLSSHMGFGKRSPCLSLPSAYLQPQQTEPSLPSVYTWYGAKSRWLAGLPSWAGEPSHCHL